MALRWRKNEPARGLAAVVARPRGSGLYDGDVKYAMVSCKEDRKHWFYVCGWDSGLPYINTCNDPSPDEATAKAEALAYVRENLKALNKKG